MKYLIISMLFFISINAQNRMRIILSSNSYIPINSELTDYNNSLTTKLDNNHLEIWDEHITMLKDSFNVVALSDTFDVIYFVANQTQESCAKNVVKRDHDGTLSGTFSFTKDQGLKGSGVNGYLKTDYIQNTDAVNATQNSTSIGQYIRAPIANDRNYGYDNSANYLIGYDPTTIRYKINSTNISIYTLAQADRYGLLTVNRVASNNNQLYLNGVLVDNEADASTGLSTVEFYLFALNIAGSPSVTYGDYELSYFWIAAGFDATGQRKMKNIIEHTLDRFGAGILP